MDKKSKIIIIVSIISLLVATISTVTYAYLKTSAIQSDSNIISTLNCLEVTIEDVTGPINITEAYPISDAEGMESTPYKFKVKNMCETQVGIDINLESLTDASSSGLYYYIKVLLDNGEIDLLRSKISATTYASGTDARRLMYASFNPNEERDYELRLWVREEATYAQAGNKTYQGKIVVVAQPIMYQNQTSAPSEWSSAGSTTLLAAIRDGSYVYADPLTIPGRASNTVYENVIGHTSDDYGTSYYFRGNVENNYVSFAGMCWRIVRVTGKASGTGEYNNAIKLVLYNYNPTGASNPCSKDIDGESNAFARYNTTDNGIIGQTLYNNSSNYNAYIGFMYGNATGSTYEAVHANTNTSPALTNLKTWYDLVFTSAQKNQLADVIWCNDKSLATSTYNPDNWTGTYNTGIGTVKTNYKGYERLHEPASATPTLICPDASTTNSSYKKISKFTASDTTYGNGALSGYKIGLLTLDEVVFSGQFAYGGKGYITKNASSSWWTMTPLTYAGSYFSVACITSSFSMCGVNYAQGLRPAIALKSTVTIVSGGAGTQANPFVVN